MLGVKVFAGQQVSGGEIIVRQRGTRFWPGDGIGIGRDHTIFATRGGTVSSSSQARKGRDHSRSGSEEASRREEGSVPLSAEAVCRCRWLRPGVASSFGIRDRARSIDPACGRAADQIAELPTPQPSQPTGSQDWRDVVPTL